MRHGDTLQVRRRADCELRDDPAVGGLVIDHDRVPVVVAFALAAEAGPQRVRRYRAVDDILGDLVEDGEAGIDDLDILRIAYRADGVRGRGIDRESTVRTGEAGADAVDAILERGRSRTAARRVLQRAIDLIRRKIRQRHHVLVALVPALVAIRLRHRVAQRGQRVVLQRRRNLDRPVLLCPRDRHGQGCQGSGKRQHAFHRGILRSFRRRAWCGVEVG